MILIIIFEKSIFEYQKDILVHQMNNDEMGRKNVILFILDPEISFWSSKMDFSKMMFRSPYDRF